MIMNMDILTEWPTSFRRSGNRVVAEAIVGICLIRLKNIKPKGFLDFLGLSSENGAHRIAVEWVLFNLIMLC